MSAGSAAIEHAFRHESGGVLATLVRQFGDIQLAEDALQDAFADAARSWPGGRAPERPAAWLTTAARRRAIDRLRRERGLRERLEAHGHELHLEDGADDPHAMLDDGEAIPDDRLRLIFTCCHPALAPAARVALTLKLLGGLTTAEVASAFLVAEPTMAQRIVRAKRKIAAANIPYRIPDEADLPERLDGVCTVLLLIFNEGYRASGGDAPIRADLCDEAIRLARALTTLLPDAPEPHGLLALMLLQDSRRGARTDPEGRYVPLDVQDRTAWDSGRIEEGLAELERALDGGRPGRYALQAAIAAEHATAPKAEATGWHRIAALYAALAQLDSSPVVLINRAVATAFAGGDGLALLAPLLADERLAGYQPLQAAHAELAARAGDSAAAAAAYAQAIALAPSEAEAQWLRERAARRAVD